MSTLFPTVRNGRRRGLSRKKYPPQPFSRLMMEANERHAKLGFVAAGIFPPPVEYMSNIKLPANIPAAGTSFPKVCVEVDVIEWDAFHDLIVIDELARCGYLGVNWGLSCGNAIGCPPIINYGSPAQKRKFLPPILRGENRMCLAVTEPQGPPLLPPSSLPTRC